jgi:hypothetical protein
MDNKEDLSRQTTTEKSSIQDDNINAEMKEQNNNKIEDNNIYDNKALEAHNLEDQERYGINNSFPSNKFQSSNLENQNFKGSHEANLDITLNSLEEPWAYQNILLDYNILDFTSK